MFALFAICVVTRIDHPAGSAKARGTSKGNVATVVWSAVCAAAAISAQSTVFDVVVDPELTLDKKMRSVVAAVAVAATEAVGLKRIFDMYDPLTPDVNTLKISVPIVPVPSDFVLAAEITAKLNSGTPVKMGCLLAVNFGLLISRQQSSLRHGDLQPDLVHEVRGAGKMGLRMRTERSGRSPRALLARLAIVAGSTRAPGTT